MQVQGFFGLGDKEIHKIGFRVCVKSEENSSIIKAYKWIDEHASGLKGTKEDDDLLEDLKTTEALFSACRRAEEGDEEQNYMYPAFPGSAWMRDSLTTDQIAKLLNVYNACRRKADPSMYELSNDQLEAMIQLVTNVENEEIPEALLAEVARDWLVQAFMILAKRLVMLEEELDYRGQSDASENGEGSAGSSKEDEGSGGEGGNV